MKKDFVFITLLIILLILSIISCSSVEVKIDKEPINRLNTTIAQEENLINFGAGVYLNFGGYIDNNTLLFTKFSGKYQQRALILRTKDGIISYSENGHTLQLNNIKTNLDGSITCDILVTKTDKKE
jgi:hypothetical protein